MLFLMKQIKHHCDFIYHTKYKCCIAVIQLYIYMQKHDQQ